MVVNKLYAASATVVVLGLAAYGLTQYGRALERADHNEKVAALQDQLAEKSLEIQMLESQAAEDTRKLVKVNQEKNDAIATNDHKTEEVKRLESIVRQERERFKKENAAAAADNLHYRVIITDAVNRVWEEGRNCIGLPESERASVLQKRLPEVAGDDITELIKFTQGEYCSCGIQYNELWRSYQRTVDECNEKPAP